MLSWAEPPSPPLTVKVTDQHSVPLPASLPKHSEGSLLLQDQRVVPTQGVLCVGGRG